MECWNRKTPKEKANDHNSNAIMNKQINSLKKKKQLKYYKVVY